MYRDEHSYLLGLELDGRSCAVSMAYCGVVMEQGENVHLSCTPQRHQDRIEIEGGVCFPWCGVHFYMLLL